MQAASNVAYGTLRSPKPLAPTSPLHQSSFNSIAKSGEAVFYGSGRSSPPPSFASPGPSPAWVPRKGYAKEFEAEAERFVGLGFRV